MDCLLNKRHLIYGLIIILIVTHLIPISNGYYSIVTEKDKQLTDFCYEFSCDYFKFENNFEKKLSECSSSNEIIIDIGKSKNNYPTLSNQKTLIKAPMSSAWPMQSHDAHHTGRSIYSNSFVTNLEKWRFYVDDGRVAENPIIDDDGVMYFGSFNWYFYAINPDGSEKWKYKTNGEIWGSSAAIDDNSTLYFGAWDHYLYALDSNGSFKWKFNANHANIASSPAIGNDGTIYFGTLWSLGDGGKIHAVNPDGTEKWRYQTGGAITSDPAIGNDETIYIGSQDSYLYALWPNGTLQWRFKTGDEIHGHPSIAEDGTVYIGSWDDYLYALYPNGSLKWKVETGWGTSNCQAIGEDGTIYVGTNKLLAFYPNGTLKWVFNFDDNKYVGKSSPAISADGILYIGINYEDYSGGEIISINTDGTERWHRKIANDWVDSSPSIAEDGSVYIGSSSSDVGYTYGYLHAFGTVTNNEPPSTPTINGPLNGKVGNSLSFKFKSNDPENLPLRYYIDWGDGSITDWTGEYESGEEVEKSHTWSEQGTFTIKCKSKDPHGEESQYGEFDITITKKSKSLQNSFLLNMLLERFPMLEVFISRLINL